MKYALECLYYHLQATVRRKLFYSFYTRNVYVWVAKRVRLAYKTYTFGVQNVYVLRVDDAWTPLGMKDTKPVNKPRVKHPEISCDARKGLFDHDQRKEMCSSDESSVGKSPYLRYVKKMKDDIEAKKSELYELENKEQEVQRKLQRVKSVPSDGNLCRNCHMRLGHTARLCEYERCSSVFS